MLLIGGVVIGILAVRQVTTYFSHAQTGTGNPQNISSRSVTGDQAIISWTTADEVISLVLYGTNPAALDQTQTELSSAKTHRITLSNLKPQTTYYYKVQVGQEIFDDSGNPWSFQTLAGADSPPRLSEAEFRQAYGTKDLKLDLNKDGVVNGFDYQLYLQQK
jgi:hypothetical protein